MNEEEFQEKLSSLINGMDPKTLEDAETLFVNLISSACVIDGYMSVAEGIDPIMPGNPIREDLLKAYYSLHVLAHPLLSVKDEADGTMRPIQDILTALFCLIVRRHQFAPLSAEQIKKSVLDISGMLASFVVVMVVSRQKELSRDDQKTVANRIAGGVSAAINKELSMYVKEIGESN